MTPKGFAAAEAATRRTVVNSRRMGEGLTPELSDAGGPTRPHWQRRWPARIRSSDFVSWPHDLERMHLLCLPPFSDDVQQLAQCLCLWRVIGRAIDRKSTRLKL